MSKWMRTTGLLIFVLLFFCGLSSVLAQDIKVYAQVDAPTVELGSLCRLTVTIEGGKNVAPVTLPDIPGVDTSFVGPSTSITMINGQVSSSQSFMYNLYPTATGAFTVPALKVMVEGGAYETEPVTVKVVSPAASGASAPPAANAVPATESLQDKIFLILSAPKKRFYVNEQIPVTIKLYIQGLAVRDVHYPEMGHVGFTVDDFQEAVQSTELLGGVKYDVVEFKTGVYPTRVGELELGPAAVGCNVLFKNHRRASAGGLDSLFGDRFFEGFFGGYDQKGVTVKSPALKLNVIPLPEEQKPQDFSGGVGAFDFDVTASPVNVKVGDPVTIRMTLKGQGNLPAVQMPVFKDQPEFKFYDPQISEHDGTKTVEQVAIPASDKVTAIPAVRFSYFDTVSGQYQSVVRGPFPLTVEEPKPGEQLKIVGLSPQDSVSQGKEEPLGQDIVFIKDRPGRFLQKGRVLYRSLLFWSGFLLLALSWAGLEAYCYFNRRLRTDIRFARRIQAFRAARDGLKEARLLMELGEAASFYDTLFKTVQNYFGHKFHIAGGAVTPETIGRVLSGRAVPAAMLEYIRTVYQECEQVRYASQKMNREEMAASLQRVEDMIRSLEKNWK